MTHRPFDANSLHTRYAFVEDCPPELFAQVATHPIGNVEERIAGVREWQHALLEGKLPKKPSWPPSEVAAPVLKALDELGIARFCQGQPELVIALLKDLLSSFERQTLALQAEVARRLKELEELERRRLEAASGPRDGGLQMRFEPLDESTLANLRAKATQKILCQPRGADARLIALWAERVRAWSEINEVFGDLGGLLGRGWDLTRGVLREAGWLDLVKLSRLIAELPMLREVIRTLGRLQNSDDAPSVSETVMGPIRRLEEELREVPTPLAPTEMRGVERSGNITRMLPVERIMLGHPKLRLLWHARRAESALLSYRAEGVETERVFVEKDAVTECERVLPRKKRGPIIAVIDTSGSMHGVPELVAKALVLEAVRTAHSEGRKCYLYSYSGPGQIVEQELRLTPEGVSELLGFIRMTFGGGSDAAGVVGRVVERLQSEAWQKADVLIASDGEWPVSEALKSLVSKVREAGARIHGIQIGNRGRTGLHEICDPVHVFHEWASLAGWSR